MTKRKPGRLVADANTLLKGNRAYLLATRKAISKALRDGAATVSCEDEEGDEICTTILCSRKMGRRIGFQPPGPPTTD